MKQEKIIIDADISNFAVCFNNECPQCNACLRYVAGRQAAKRQNCGYAIFPSALKEDGCRFYRTAEKVELAYGLHSMKTRIPHYLHATVRRAITHYLGSVGTYYRYDKGTRKLTPRQQEDIKRMLNKLGCPLERPFDHYVKGYDLE